MAVTIGLDIGTTNWKAAAFTPAGKQVSLRKMPTPTHIAPEGWAYYDPREMREGFASLLRAVSADCAGQKILGVSVASMTESVVPLDENGDDLFPIITWYDTTPRAEAEEVRARMGEKKVFSVCGLDIDPISSLPKIMWIRNHYPRVFEKARVWLQMADYLYFLLCGETVTEYSMAGRTLLFDIGKRDWSDEMTGTFGVPRSVMPRVQAASSLVGCVHRKAWEATGIPIGTPVFAGGHDHLCASLPTGCLNGRKMLDSSGTAEAILYFSEKGAPLPAINQGARVGLYLDPSRYVLWGDIKSSGASADWAYRTLTTRSDWTGENEATDYDAVLSACGRLPIGSDGALFLPHLRGSGAPDWNTDHRGALLNLTDRHSAPYLTRAVFEGLSCQARVIVEMHRRIAGAGAEGLCVAGGSSRNLLWQQLKADLLQQPVELSPIGDATVQGAALLAAIGAGEYGSLEEASTACAAGNRVLLPNKENATACEALYRRYCMANEAMGDLHCRLARLDRGNS